MSVPVGPTGATLEATARRFHEHKIGDRVADLTELMHPEARMTFLRDDLGPLEGREAIVAVLRDTRNARYYSARITTCEWIDDSTLLVSGRARYADTLHSLTDADVWWIDQFRDGLLWRIDVFKSKPAFNERFH